MRRVAKIVGEFISFLTFCAGLPVHFVLGFARAGWNIAYNEVAEVLEEVFPE